MKKSSVKKLGLLAGGTLALGLGANATNDLSATDLGSAGELRSELLTNGEVSVIPIVLNSEVEFSCGEGKCGEGKCGEGKKADKKSDKKESKAKEGKCGEGKCGEGKCGEKGEKSDKKKESKGEESKCGEGKCGG